MVTLDTTNNCRSLLFTYEPRDEDEDEESLERVRRDALMSTDHLMQDGNFSILFKAKMAECEAKIGQANMQQLFSRIDADIIHQIRHVLLK